MKKPKNKTNYFEVMEEAGKKYGVKVTDVSKRGVRAIGFLGGVRERLEKPNSPIDPGGE